MEQKPAAAAGYQTLGRRTFWFMTFQRSKTAIIFLIIGIILFVVGAQKFLTAPWPLYIGYAGAAAIVIAVIAFLSAISSAELIYKTYTFMLDDDALKIKSGIITKSEIAIPYRQIQNVDIERSVTDQFFGLSRLVILTAGQANAKDGDEDEGVLPALDKELASWLQEELIKRTDIQKVTEEKPEQS